MSYRVHLLVEVDKQFGAGHQASRVLREEFP